MSTYQRVVPNIFNFMKKIKVAHFDPSPKLKSSLKHAKTNECQCHLKQLGSPGSRVPCLKVVPCLLKSKAMQNVNRVPSPIWGLGLLASLPSKVKTFHVAFLLEIWNGKLLMQCTWENWGLPHAHLECRVCGLKAYRIHRPIGLNCGGQKWWSPNNATASLSLAPVVPILKTRRVAAMQLAENAGGPDCVPPWPAGSSSWNKTTQGGASESEYIRIIPVISLLS